jgi:hypothetical protein
MVWQSRMQQLLQQKDHLIHRNLDFTEGVTHPVGVCKTGIRDASACDKRGNKTAHFIVVTQELVSGGGCCAHSAVGIPNPKMRPYLPLELETESTKSTNAVTMMSRKRKSRV